MASPASLTVGSISPANFNLNQATVNNSYFQNPQGQWVTAAQLPRDGQGNILVMGGVGGVSGQFIPAAIPNYTFGNDSNGQAVQQPISAAQATAMVAQGQVQPSYYDPYNKVNEDASNSTFDKIGVSAVLGGALAGGLAGGAAAGSGATDAATSAGLADSSAASTNAAIDAAGTGGAAAPAATSPYMQTGLFSGSGATTAGTTATGLGGADAAAGATEAAAPGVTGIPDAAGQALTSAGTGSASTAAQITQQVAQSGDSGLQSWWSGLTSAAQAKLVGAGISGLAGLYTAYQSTQTASNNAANQHAAAVATQFTPYNVTNAFGHSNFTSATQATANAATAAQNGYTITRDASGNPGYTDPTSGQFVNTVPTASSTLTAPVQAGVDAATTAGSNLLGQAATESAQTPDQLAQSRYDTYLAYTQPRQAEQLGAAFGQQTGAGTIGYSGGASDTNPVFRSLGQGFQDQDYSSYEASHTAAQQELSTLIAQGNAAYTTAGTTAALGSSTVAQGATLGVDNSASAASAAQLNAAANTQNTAATNASNNAVNSLAQGASSALTGLTSPTAATPTATGTSVAGPSVPGAGAAPAVSGAPTSLTPVSAPAPVSNPEDNQVQV